MAKKVAVIVFGLLMLLIFSSFALGAQTEKFPIEKSTHFATYFKGSDGNYVKLAGSFWVSDRLKKENDDVRSRYVAIFKALTEKGYIKVIVEREINWEFEKYRDMSLCGIHTDYIQLNDKLTTYINCSSVPGYAAAPSSHDDEKEYIKSVLHILEILQSGKRPSRAGPVSGNIDRSSEFNAAYAEHLEDLNELDSAFQNAFSGVCKAVDYYKVNGRYPETYLAKYRDDEEKPGEPDKDILNFCAGYLIGSNQPLHYTK